MGTKNEPILQILDTVFQVDGEELNSNNERKKSVWLEQVGSSSVAKLAEGA